MNFSCNFMRLFVFEWALFKLEPEERPVRTFSFDALSDTAYYLEVYVKWGFGVLDPVLKIRTAEDAVPVLKELKPTW